MLNSKVERFLIYSIVILGSFNIGLCSYSKGLEVRQMGISLKGNLSNAMGLQQSKENKKTEDASFNGVLAEDKTEPKAETKFKNNTAIFKTYNKYLLAGINKANVALPTELTSKNAPLTETVAAFANTAVKETNLQWSIAATKSLNSKEIMTTGINKGELYDAALNATESLSNPVIRLLIDDGKAIQDNKQYADAFPRPNVASWRTDKKFMELAELGKLQKQQTGNIQPQTAQQMIQLVKQYYILPGNGISEQIKVPLNETLTDYKKSPIAAKVPKDYIDAANHIVNNWKNLVRQTPAQTKSSLIPLPHPYVVPGGRFDEVYYWDSYFTILGLKDSGCDKLAKGMVSNFMYMVDKFGFIPNGGRVYYLSRSQPPLLPQMIDEVAPTEKEIKVNPEKKEWLEKAYKVATHEYTNEWINSPHFVPEYGLNRYYDVKDTKRIESWGTDNLETANTKEFFQHERSEAESGWDFSDRYSNRCSDFLSVDLNSILYKNEKNFEKWARMLGKDQEAAKWATTADTRKQQMQKFLWNDKTGMYSDFDIKEKKISDYMSLATTFPLWAGIATPEQAEKVRDNLVNDFEFDGGLVTSLKKPNVERQWNFPNGWPPLECVAIEGLEKYGFLKDTQRITKKWMDLNTKVFKEQGKFVEKYNVVRNNVDTGGTYPLQDGFGWTNGVYLHLLNNISSKY